jgi:hypothetical protein
MRKRNRAVVDVAESSTSRKRNRQSVDRPETSTSRKRTRSVVEVAEPSTPLKHTKASTARPGSLHERANNNFFGSDFFPKYSAEHARRNRLGRKKFRNQKRIVLSGPLRDSNGQPRLPLDEKYTDALKGNMSTFVNDNLFLASILPSEVFSKHLIKNSYISWSFTPRSTLLYMPPLRCILLVERAYAA